MADKNVPDDNAFDDISRILASPMPRRQALRLIVGISTATVLESFFPRFVLGAPSTEMSAEDLLKRHVGKISLSNTTTYDVIEVLRNKHGIPISFIQDENSAKLDIHVADSSVKAILGAITQPASGYTWKQYKNRIVVFPQKSRYLTVVSGVNVERTPRVEASFNYITYLSTHYPDFNDLGALFIGNNRSVLVSTPVTLSPKATVLTNFLELLGQDPAVYFTVLKETSHVWSFKYSFAFNKVQIIPAQTPVTTSRRGMFKQNPFCGRPRLHFASTLLAASGSSCRPLTATYPQTKSKEPCPGKSCGNIFTYTADPVTCCEGDNCSGTTRTETVSAGDTNTCSAQPPSPGDPCTIGPNGETNYTDSAGTSRKCSDNYSICVSGESHPTTSCTYTVNQTILVDGKPTSTNIITFTVTADPTGKTCGTYDASLSQQQCHTSNQCCQDASGKPILCGSSCGSTDACCSLGQICCPADKVCTTDLVTSSIVCCPPGTQSACNGSCCPKGQVCVIPAKVCCPSAQYCDAACCTTDQSCAGSPGKRICCPTGQTNCNGTCCAGPCCNNVCCAKGQTCIGGVCCGAPTPQARMSHAEILQGRYATDDLSQCCQPGQVPCVNACCDAGSVCCSGSCCAGTCDSSGTCITNNENK